MLRIVWAWERGTNPLTGWERFAFLCAFCYNSEDETETGGSRIDRPIKKI